MGEMDGLEVTECTRCPELVDSRSQIVNGTGPADADVLFVGEGPGEKEDEQGEPFVGRSGTILDEKLEERGLSREDVRITNCVRCRPPENRDPTKQELENCRGYLESEIEQVDPSVVVTLGKVPSEHLLDRSVAVTKEAGSVEQAELGGSVRDVLVCVHPAATLYDRSQEDTLDAALDKAAGMAGGSGGQSQLGDY
ncbi:MULTISPECIES: uracil-DNA glycosylase [Halorussus]|uniref:uracil-DNA glycosylase n=1 Tax=Halorussus TaxID=1070314 RepID=UPI00209E164C|nr:uracil-DNA glycosylase [Halorussus vallis]USZ73865.1 uracil-DNA glycosylase [Halorussus vallis]